MNKTTQVPTEWLEELKKLADKASEVMFDMICKEKVDHKNIIYIAQFCGQAKGAKYFQPQPDSDPQLFQQCLKLLRNLAEFQNGAPLEKYKVQYEETMHEVWAFLGDYENECLKHQPNSVDLEEFAKWLYLNFSYNPKSNWYSKHPNGAVPRNFEGQLYAFSEVFEAFKKSKG
jgi:hypothetical protein